MLKSDERLVSCPHCHHGGQRIRPEHLGRRITCRRCERSFRAPTDSDPSPIDVPPRLAPAGWTPAAKSDAGQPRASLLEAEIQQVRDELGQILAELRLPTLIVTHAFDDAAVLAGRIGVMDQGRLVQLATPGELLRSPANVMVAELTGANVLEGTAARHPSGSCVTLRGGGVLQPPRRAVPRPRSVGPTVYHRDRVAQPRLALL